MPPAFFNRKDLLNMKKITILSMLLCMAVTLFAQKSVVFDFAASGEGLPTAAAAEATYQYNGYDLPLQNCKYSEGYGWRRLD